MKLNQAAQGFSAMGSSPRMEVLQTLIKAGPDGLRIGEIQTHTKIPPSTLAHHLKALLAARLIIQTKSGRETITLANYDHLEALAAYILKECCSQQSQLPKSETREECLTS